jgi:citrate:succinate antiporter/L-tartrate/succinate antiporter
VKITWRTVAPLCIWLAIYLVPAPAGLNANQWHYFALFAAVIAGLILESMPVGAVGLIGLTVAGVMGYVEPDPNKSLRWMLGGFSESTVWLIVGAFVFSIGYRKSGLGRRLALLLVRGLGRSTIGLGYAVAFSDLVLARRRRPIPRVAAARSIPSSATFRGSTARSPDPPLARSAPM